MQPTCIYPDQSSPSCKFSTINFLAEPHPEIMTFNLNWDTDSPGVQDILRTLVSIPEEFNITNLYTATQTASQNYAFRGMICFTNGHYLAYFRRIFIKIGFLSGIDITNVNAQAAQIKRDEIQPETEWIQYNDSSIRFVSDNWSGILKECIEHKVFPTVLFYEKLYDVEDDAEYKSSPEFNEATKDLSDLITLARRIEREEKQNTEFSAADIEE